MGISRPPQTIQFWLLIAGLWLVLTGLIGANLPATEPTNPIKPTTGASLKVEPARQSPGSTINQLQGAGGLQRQSDNALQQPTSVDSLQPNEGPSFPGGL